MYNKAVLNRLLLAAVMSCPAVACSSDAGLQQQAQDFCAIHHADRWQHIAPNFSAEALHEERAQRISQLVTSAPLLEAIEQAEQRPKNQATYLQLQRQVESLTNEPWACPEYQDFHAVSFVRADGNEADVMKHEIEIQVTDKHAYVLGDQTYPTISAVALQSALGDAEPAGTRIRVVLDKGATDDALPLIFNAADAVGITSIVVVSD